MVKLIALSIWRHGEGGAEPIKLAESRKLDSFSIWTRGSVGENVTFASRTVVQRTAIGTKQSIGLQDIPYLVHVYARYDGLIGVVVSDEDYPSRVCFGLLNQTLTKFADKVGDKWKRVAKDQEVEPPFMKEDLITFQDPNNDKINKIQKDLDEVKDVIHKSIEDLLQRGETLDALVYKSNDVSALSKQFYQTAKKQNSCCR